MDVSRSEANLSSMLWRVANLRLDHITDIPSTNAIVLTRILVAPTVIIDTVQQDRNTLEHHEDRRSIVVAGPSAELNEKWLHTGRNGHTGAGEASFPHEPALPESNARNVSVQQERSMFVVETDYTYHVVQRTRNIPPLPIIRRTTPS